MIHLKSNLLIILIFLCAGCDFTSSLHKNILRAQEYVTSQEFDKASDLYEKILEAKPSDSIRIKIHYQLGEIYSIYLNRYSDAIEHFKKVLEITYEPLWQVKALEKVGEIYFENLKDWKEASNAYNTLVNFEPVLEHQDFYRFRYAECLLELGMYKHAKVIYEKLIALSKQEYAIRSYFSLGMMSFYQEDWDVAVNYWFEYIKREKRQDRIVQTKFLIANAYETNEKLKEAYNIYYSIIGQYPNPEVIKERLESLYNRRLARKR